MPNKEMHYDENEARYLQTVAKMDEATSIFLARQLEYVRARTLEVKKAPLEAFSVFPVQTDIPVGAESAVTRTYDSVGTAKIISNYADDLPRVDVAATEDSVKVHSLGDSYGYNFREIQNAQFANTNLSTRKAEMARRAIDIELNRIAWSGDTSHKITGFIGNPNISEYTVPTNAAGTTKIEDMTADELIDFFNEFLEAVSDATNGVESVNTVLLYPEAYNRLTKTRIPNTTDSVMKYLQEVNPQILRWIKVYRLKGAGDSGKDLLYAGYFDPNYVRLEIPERFHQHEVEKRNLEYVVDCTASTVGVTVDIPYAFIKAQC
ncbi:hypothetical protein SAMN02745671_01178 [Anaerovibrio lipolyticus DSM 3074]|uniref:Phage major capsid protein E n=1 Tax=Anaerovibrio lipolyticus DSM 3074 TaxID=1120997 RepID=A0A1M6CLX5_9FIRM|nr:DUF2184 domain-containing protein [Anaerovibrio lipolyticus]SHI62042.1 hypothetical protein SAMN02745671_01178 [Anaerovibrio lipolyticus DSM 3074]